MQTINKTPSSQYKVRFHDCDMFGHLNNARYLDYMIAARQDHLQDNYQFRFSDYYSQNRGWVVTHHEIQYLKPARFDETITISSLVLGVTDDALHVEIMMLNENGTQLKALLRSTLTYINLQTGKRELHPPTLINWAENLITPVVGSTIQERISHLKQELLLQKQIDSAA
jgi:acyl-CoA thioester hydrolase